MILMVALASTPTNELYIAPSPYAWLRSRAPVPTTYAPACEPLSEFDDVLKNRTSRARGVTSIYTGVTVLSCETASSYVIVFWELRTILYNGEGIDNRTGLYNFRARWYSASSGRFERLDPFAGNPTDPFSFNKYGFVHGNPIGMTDPTGLFSFGNVMAGIAIAGLAVGVGANVFSSILSSTERSQASGVGGRKIDGAIEGIVSDLTKQWDRLDSAKKQLLFNAAHTSSGWEIREFKDEQYESMINPDGGLARTVSYDGDVYFKVEVNYFLFGAINYLANRDGISNFNLITGYNNGSVSNMRTVITKYRGLSGIAYVGRRNDGSILGRELWAVAGWMYARDGKFEAPTRMKIQFARADNFPLEVYLNAYIGTPDGNGVAYSIDMRGRAKQLGEQ